MFHIPSRGILEDWLLRLAPAHPLALFRMGVGAFLVCAWGSLLLRAGELSLAESLLFCAVFASAFLIAIGALLRLASLMVAFVYTEQLGVLTIAQVQTTTLTSPTESLFLLVTLLILAYSDADGALSHHMYTKYGRVTEWEEVSILPQRLLSLLFAGIFVCIGYIRLWHPSVATGARLQSVLIGPLGTRFGATVARVIPTPLFNWISSILKAFGLMLPICLWIGSVRHLFVIGGMVLAALIALMIGEYWMFVLLPGMLLFLEPEEMRTLVHQFLKIP